MLYLMAGPQEVLGDQCWPLQPHNNLSNINTNNNSYSFLLISGEECCEDSRTRTSREVSSAGVGVGVVSRLLRDHTSQEHPTKPSPEQLKQIWTDFYFYVYRDNNPVIMSEQKGLLTICQMSWKLIGLSGLRLALFPFIQTFNFLYPYKVLISIKKINMKQPAISYLADSTTTENIYFN